MLTVTAVYDDRVPIPPDVTEIIGVDHFSDVLRRRVRLGDMLRETVERPESTTSFTCGTTMLPGSCMH